MTDPKPPKHLPSSAASAEPVRQSPARRLAHFYETLTPPRCLRLDQLYAPDARFKRPFNEVAGTAAIRRVFEQYVRHHRGARASRSPDRIEQANRPCWAGLPLSCAAAR